MPHICTPDGTSTRLDTDHRCGLWCSSPSPSVPLSVGSMWRLAIWRTALHGAGVATPQMPIPIIPEPSGLKPANTTTAPNTRPQGGEGPDMFEAVSFERSPHSTADDSPAESTNAGNRTSHTLISEMTSQSRTRTR